MPNLNLEPLVLPRDPRSPSIKIVVLWPQDDPRREPKSSGENDKRDDAVAWGVSVACRWLEDEFAGNVRLNIDLNVKEATAPWTKDDIKRWSAQGSGYHPWWVHLIERTGLGLHTYTGASGLILVCPGITAHPFDSAWAWGNGLWRWANPNIPPVVGMGEWHYSMFQSRNAAFTRWLSTVPQWWSAYSKRWEHATAILAHELGHMLSGMTHPVPDDDTIMTPARVADFPAVGLGLEYKDAMLKDRRWWL
ncbi:MAG: hypothetical protein Q8R28_16900 [Dehalococcoidia bacterium]|nr:hypothetical protein [Dehalococcoidia bacterium]